MRSQTYDHKWIPEPNSGCWIWIGEFSSTGYGIISSWSGNKRIGRKKAHRVIYEIERGAVPEGLELDHLCRNRFCVNPAHLEPVTHRINILRGDGPAAKHAARTNCLKCGGPFHNRRSHGRICLMCERKDRSRRREVHMLRCGHSICRDFSTCRIKTS